MSSEELYQRFMERLSETRIYLEQGLEEGVGEIFDQILTDIETSELPAPRKEELRLRIKSESKGLAGGPIKSRGPFHAVSNEPSQHFQYGLALMDGQFWDEAISEFNAAAELGYEPLASREYCGDCAARMGSWDEAIRYYNFIYSDHRVPEERRKRILLKINKCSQTQRKTASSSMIQARNSGNGATAPRARPDSEVVTSSISSLDGYSVNSVMGRTIASWTAPDDDRQGRAVREYRILNLLHVGSSSLIIEIEQQESGKRFAGQMLTGLFGEVLSAGMLADWAREQAAYDSRNLLKIYDLAHSNGYFFFVRDYLPLSLSDVLSTGEVLPIPLAIRFAYQILEALGDLHLHMGPDGQPGNSFHLDLRPSRVLVRTDQPSCKVCNGGLWKKLENAAPEQTRAGRLPLHYLPYRAPEQFRPYLARKRPPFFTDIYLFGALFYEMLTGIPAFKASSYEEYEIQHCEQYPSPPRVWRSEIPDVINEMIMQCLESNTTKRFRSTTQMSLIIEKAFADALARPKDDSYQKFLQKLKLI